MRIRGSGGGDYRDRVEVEDALLEQWRNHRGTQFQGRTRVSTFEAQYPASRQLADGRINDLEDMAIEVRTKALEHGGIESLTADGGICGPVDVWLGLETIAQASRPLRSRVASYKSKRGGLSFSRPMTLADINSATTPTEGNAIGVITEAQDAASTYDKSYQVIECGDQVEKRVDAVYLQLEFGRFMERSNPERKSQFTDLSLAAYARFSEQRLLAAMIANSKDTNAPQELGATRDFLTRMNQAAINYRAIHRMDPSATLETVVPGWVGWGLLPDDQTRALQSYPEQFDVNAAKIEQWLRARNIIVGTWFQDDFTTALANGGGINAYPSTFKALLYHPGAHVYIDQGELDLGTVTDTETTKNNVFRTFAEEFWTTAMWGVDSWAIEFSLCANGASAGSVEPSCGS